MDILTALFVMLLCLLLKGFFSGSEIALVNSDKIKLRHREKVGDRGASLALKLSQTPDVLLSTTLVGTNICTVVLTTVGAGKTDQPFFITREQLRAVVDMAEHGTAMSAFGRGRIRRVIRFAETTVAQAMIPIAEATAINRNKSTDEAIALVRKHGFNRLPVYEKSIGDIIGIVTLTTWDFLDDKIAEQPLESLMKPALYVSPLQTIDQVLPVIRKRDDHMAIVVDEFGTAIGMITMEDIVEEVVGEIDVGYDFEEYLPKRKRVYEKLAEEVYLMDSRLSVAEAGEVLGLDLPVTEFHTIGGLVLARLRHIPKEGEFVVESGYRFTVAKATRREILKLRVEPETYGHR